MMPEPCEREASQGPFRSSAYLLCVEEQLMKVIERLSLYLLWVGMLALLIMMAFVNYDILARLVFSKPVAGSTELVSMLLAVVSFFCLALPQFHKRHITITFVVDMLKPRGRALVDGVTALICALFTVIIIWQTFEQGIGDMNGNAISSIMAIPAAPFKFAAAFATSFLLLAFVLDFLRALPLPAKQEKPKTRDDEQSR
jgi:TRAP-type C4-dicarboxylate transport system permease small subunit